MNNPSRYIDPSGHRPNDGCETGEICSVTSETIIEDNRRNKEFRQTTEHNQCKAGQKIYCGTDVTEIIGFAATMLIGGAAAETFVLGGGIAGVLDGLSLTLQGTSEKVLYACLMSGTCQRLFSTSSVGNTNDVSKGRQAIKDLLSQSTQDPRSQRVWDNAGTAADGMSWFERIADPGSTELFSKGIKGTVDMVGTVNYRVISETAPYYPTLQLKNIAGLIGEMIKIKFTGGG